MALTKNDYDNLWNVATQWRDNNWTAQIDGGRFSSDDDKRPASDWEWAYWFDDYGSVLWAKFYLISKKIAYEITYDNNSDEWVILTNEGLRK